MPSRVFHSRNPYVERLIGTLRRDCLDHVLVFGERHLRQILALYSSYYNETRTHLGLGKDAPLGRAIQRSGTIIATPLSTSRARTTQKILPVSQSFASPTHRSLDKDAVPSRHSAPSHHNLSSADFITNIAESNFRYTQMKF